MTFARFPMQNTPMAPAAVEERREHVANVLAVTGASVTHLSAPGVPAEASRDLDALLTALGAPLSLSATVYAPDEVIP